MRIFLSIQSLIYFAFVFGCSSTSNFYYGNNMMSANITRIDRTKQKPPDTSFAAMFGTEWMDDKPYELKNFVGAPRPSFDIHLAEDDSVTIYYTDLKGVIVCQPLRTFLRKGSYKYTPDLFGFSDGVYLHICKIGHSKRTGKILLMR